MAVRNVRLLPGETFTKRCSRSARSIKRINLLVGDFVTVRCKSGRPRPIQVSCGTPVSDRGTVVVGDRQIARITCTP